MGDQFRPHPYWALRRKLLDDTPLDWTDQKDDPKRAFVFDAVAGVEHDEDTRQIPTATIDEPTPPAIPWDLGPSKLSDPVLLLMSKDVEVQCIKHTFKANDYYHKIWGNRARYLVLQFKCKNTAHSAWEKRQELGSKEGFIKNEHGELEWGSICKDDVPIEKETTFFMSELCVMLSPHDNWTIHQWVWPFVRHLHDDQELNIWCLLEQKGQKGLFPLVPMFDGQLHYRRNETAKPGNSTVEKPTLKSMRITPGDYIDEANLSQGDFDLTWNIPAYVLEENTWVVNDLARFMGQQEAVDTFIRFLGMTPVENTEEVQVEKNPPKAEPHNLLLSGAFAARYFVLIKAKFTWEEDGHKIDWSMRSSNFHFRESWSVLSNTADKYKDYIEWDQPRFAKYTGVLPVLTPVPSSGDTLPGPSGGNSFRNGNNRGGGGQKQLQPHL